MPSPSGPGGRPFALDSPECENWWTAARPDPVGNARQQAPRPPRDERSPGKPPDPLTPRKDPRMLRRLLARATCLAWVPLLLLSPASGAGADLMQERLAGLKAIQKQLLLAEPAETVERLERFREWHRRHPGARPKAASAGGRVGERPRWRQPMLEGDPQRPVAGRPRLVAPRSQLATPPNILVNNPAGEPLGTDQSEVSLAAYGNYVVAAWNDGIGYDNCPDCLSTQGFGYSTDGGTT